MCALGKENSTYKKQAWKENDSGNSKCLIRRSIAYKMKVTRNIRNIRKNNLGLDNWKLIVFYLRSRTIFQGYWGATEEFWSKNFM